MPAPYKPKDQSYPALKWHPETGDCRLFHSEGQVPKGWLDQHPRNLAPEKLDPASPAALPMTRKEIVEALNSGGISYDPKAKASVLFDQLTVAVKEALTEANISFDDAADTKELLALLPTPE
jgi:hypothetical protein